MEELNEVERGGELCLDWISRLERKGVDTADDSVDLSLILVALLSEIVEF